MRPQHITAENTAGPGPHTPAPAYRFNEAAAYHCGKRGVARAVTWLQRALLQ